jgi:membrane protein DedA with SNARE-associated domain
MEQLLQPDSPLFQFVAQWGYWAVFLGIMIENAGVPVPGETIIIVASLLSAKGVLDIQWVYLSCVFGATLGDNIGYLIGKLGGQPLLLSIATFYRIPPETIAQAEQRFLQHASMTVFLGRFVAILRIFAGPLAGVMRMPWFSFFCANAAGAAVWCLIVVGLSYLLGSYVAHLMHQLGYFLLVCVLGLVLWMSLHYFLRKKHKP